MELISKVSKGSKMDQIYIPKQRTNFEVGSCVLIKPLEAEKRVERPYFYNVPELEPTKLIIIKEIFDVLENFVKDYDNIIITGSFLDKGFNFNDIDVILIIDKKIYEGQIKNYIENKLKIKIHLILLNNKNLINGLETDPLYQMMLSRCISKKRFIFKIKQKINYKILDLHLLKSKPLIINFDYLTGKEKYYLIKNIIAISLFLKHKKINDEEVDREIKKLFNLENIDIIKNNMLEKKKFLEKFKKTYKNLFNEIMKGIKNGTKQE